MSPERDVSTLLGRRIAELTGESPDASRLARQQLRLDQRMRRPAGRRRLALALAAGVAAGVVGVLVLRSSAPPALRFSIDGGSAPSAAPVWVRAPAGRAVEIAFADGSALALEGGAVGRVVDVTSGSVRAALESGRMQARIHHRPGVEWVVDAGPYHVRVEGTVFTVTWTPASETLEVSVAEGIVRVDSDAKIQAQTRVTAGHTLRIGGDGKDVVLGSAAEAPGGAPPVAAPPPALPTSRLPPPHVRRAAPPPAGPVGGDGSSHVRAGWREAAARGRYAEAHAEAIQQGLFDDLTRADAETLWELATIARYARDAKRARDVLLRLREVGPPSERTHLAAFFLGAVAADLGRNESEAVEWLETYLREDAAGALREEAFGRLMRSASALGRPAEAAKAAARYLREFPRGAYQKAAHEMAREPYDERKENPREP